MSTNRAVAKLHHDLNRYNAAQKKETHDAAQVKTDRAAEQKALASIKSQEQAIIDAFVKSPPTDPAQTAKLLGQLVSLGAKSVTTQDSYQAKLAKDGKNVAADKKSVKADRQQALHDLKPAEYHLSLKDTNIARKQLGLKPLTKPLRQQGSGKVVDLAKKYLGRYETDLQAHGITLPCPPSESCANFVTSMLHKAGAINFRSLGVADMSARLKAAGWHVVPLSQAKPGDVWVALNPRGAPSEQHTELVASNNGHVTLIGSNNHPNPGNQQINYDTGSAYISGSYILAPPGR